MPKSVQVLKSADLAPGQSRVVEVEGRELALFNVEGAFHCLSNVCPHVGGPLGEGALKGETVVCPWHGWRFNVKTGANELGSRKAECFSARVEGDWVLVDLPD
jgi:nitrite reductase/ring-hydroxylating ferredoxin subunit